MAATNFPFTMTLTNLKNSNGDFPRFNMKADGTYATASTVAITGVNVVVQGYGTSPDDRTRATVDGGTTNGNVVSLQSAGAQLLDLIIANNATGGAISGVACAGGTNFLARCVTHGIRGTGFALSSSASTIVECEAYDCNKSNTANCCGFSLVTQCIAINCIAHDNTGSNTDGFLGSSGTNPAAFINCISESNGRHGFSVNGASSTQVTLFLQCDAYSNAGDGLNNLATSNNTATVIRNCNFIKNTGWGINSAITTGRWFGAVENCGFGAGTAANGNGTTNATDMVSISGSVTYATNATPYVDPANGDFRINLAAAINAGRGTFTETAASYAGTVGYPDIGAAQHYDVQKGFTFGG